MKTRSGSTYGRTPLPAVGSRGLYVALGLVLLFACESSKQGGSGAGAGRSGSSHRAGATAASGQSGQGGAGAVNGTGGSSDAGSVSAGSGGSSAGATPAGGAGQGGGAGDTQTRGGNAGTSVSGGNGGDATPGGGGTSSGTGGMNGSAGSVGPTTPAVHFVGRVDTSDPSAVRFAWSGSGAIARFRGTSVAVELEGGQQYTVVLDGQVRPKLVASNGSNSLATGLTAGEHVVELYRRTEASEGESIFRGFVFADGELLPPPPAPSRRLEFVGDSITCGYGNEGPDMNCSFSPDTENHYLTYAALTARALGAELSTVAWSGKGVVCNYGDDAASCTNPFPTYYDRILPNRADSLWDFSRFQPDAVVVNLGTNDFSTSSDPDADTFQSAYRAFLERIRGKYPNAHILCTNGPMLSGTDLSTARTYIANVVTALGDPKISVFEITPQDGSDGYGCDWHPSLQRHAKMAEQVTAALRSALGW